jgi:peptidyl-prolyl cis-trans isomerase B (cyclophilin B)
MVNAGQILRSLVLLLLLLAMCAALCLPARAQGGRDQIVVMQTTKGPIRMRIFYSLVPYTAGNFLELVESGFYNGLSFHRVESWVVQGGDPTGTGNGNFVDPDTHQPKFLRLEIHPRLNHNQAGAVAMARSQSPNSASCQFYITKYPMPQLNGKYAVFGRVLSGMEAVQAMRPGDRIISATILPQDNPPAENSAPPSEGPTDRRSPPRDSGF